MNTGATALEFVDAPSGGDSGGSNSDIRTMCQELLVIITATGALTDGEAVYWSDESISCYGR